MHIIELLTVVILDFNLKISSYVSSSVNFVKIWNFIRALFKRYIHTPFNLQQYAIDNNGAMDIVKSCILV